ncbi:MAG: toll/interleukin-1 receptor domain-containing protein [Bacteroidetes bacterium]|nr:toll/interleukin-1 receptor domain-containing protein [Bacteroidota bacterium]
MKNLYSLPVYLSLIWHAKSDRAYQIAQQIQRHFSDFQFRNFTGGDGIEVIYNSIANFDVSVRIPLNIESGHPSITVVMIDQFFTRDDQWFEFFQDLQHQSAISEYDPNFIPVVMNSDVFERFRIDMQALRWDKWDLEDEPREKRLIRELTYSLALVLRNHLQRRKPSTNEPTHQSVELEKFQVFLSHTKQGEHGEVIAKNIRRWLQDNSRLSSFLDIYDISAGELFPDVIDRNIERSVFLAIRTDYYSSSEWCRREVIEAKRKGVPFIVIDCVSSDVERSFPYLGNVPVVRMDSEDQGYLPQVAGRLFNEILKDLLWRCRIESLPLTPSNVFFLSRPPELISIIFLDSMSPADVIVYPDPPLGSEEINLLTESWKNLHVQTISQWLARNSTQVFIN